MTSFKRPPILLLLKMSASWQLSLPLIIPPTHHRLNLLISCTSMPPCPNFSSSCRELTCKSAHSDLVKNLERDITSHRHQLLTENLTSNVGLSDFCYDHVLQPLLEFVSCFSQRGTTVVVDASYSRGGLLFCLEMSVDEELSAACLYMLLRDHFHHNGHTEGLPMLLMGLTFDSHPTPWLNTFLHECYDIEFQLQFTPHCVIHHSSKTDRCLDVLPLPFLTDIGE